MPWRGDLVVVLSAQYDHLRSEEADCSGPLSAWDGVSGCDPACGQAEEGTVMGDGPFPAEASFALGRHS